MFFDTKQQRMTCQTMGFVARLVFRAEPSSGALFGLGFGVDGVISMVSSDASGSAGSSAGSPREMRVQYPDPG